jgi:hypothetical protein
MTSQPWLTHVAPKHILNLFLLETTFGLWMEPIYSPGPAITRTPSDGEFPRAWATRNEWLIGGILVLVGRVSKMRLGLLLVDLPSDRLSFSGVEMASDRLR